MADKILIGTSSWTDPTLIKSGKFYPPDVKTPEERLQFYARHFSLVEVDSSYYALPSERNAALWVQRTPDTFVFDIKAFALFTQHPTQVPALPKDIRAILSPEDQKKARVYYRALPEEALNELWDRFRAALLPLDSAGKLGAVFFQFPPWFVPSHANKDYILSLKDKLPQYPLAVEFRQHTWLDEAHQVETLSFLRENGLSFTCVDEPQGFKSSVPPVVAATAPLAVVRFHGRNRENWEKSGLTTAERFRYLYSEAELQEWVPRIEHLSATAQEVHALMNNCYEDYAVRNAQQLRMLL
ncbi:MAG: DUF72 domain-containing protein [Chloroflexota bacterium]|nr:MAG: DUF72 domain-containing protein [Chloroflexota bacterium]